MKVLGVDPGTAATGYGVVETGNGVPGRFGRLIECGVIRFPRGRTLPHRLEELHAEIAALIAKHRPTALALRAPGASARAPQFRARAGARAGDSSRSSGARR